MKNLKSVSAIIGIVFVVACAHISASAQTAEDRNKLAAVNASGSSVRWDVTAPYSSLTLTVAAPDGRVFSKEFKGGSSPHFSIADGAERLPDGQYTYEMRLTPISSPTRKDVKSNGRGKDDEPEAVRAARKSEAPAQSLVESGNFLVVNGAVVVAGAQEEGGRQPISKVASPGTISSNAVTKNEQHHPLLIAKPDDVIPDDLIVQGSACVGLDCVNGEVFGFDTIRLKENNTRLQFDDTSAAPFPTNNWQIRANSSASGGASFLGFVDQGASGNSETGTIVFEVDAGAPANALKVSSTGKVGLRTATPVLDLHITTSDTPAHRLEQTNAGGFTAQTWDIAGNEANFFVRDVTGGSRLPFRIRPGAPTSSVDVAASGNVGVGTASPGFHLHVQGTGIQTIAVESTQNGNNAQFAFIGKTAGGTAQQWLLGENLATTGGAFEIFDNTAAQNRFFINTSGNVGIGTTAPDLKLSVSGDADKSVGGGSWQVFSDERLKNIKGNFNSGLKAVMQLQPIRYQYKLNNALGLQSETENVGFGAQSLQKVVPEAVTRNSNGYLMVNNDPILWTMLNAIKEQQKEIEQLKGQIKQLRAVSRRRR
jgi:hypothetical protein